MEYKKMVLRKYTGTIGTDETEFCLVPIDMSQDELDAYAWEAACQNAESYGLYPPDHDGMDEDTEDTDHNIEGCFEEYDPDKHDGLRVGGDISWTEL